MAYKVIYKKRFNNKLVKLLQYLELVWGEKVSIEFLERIDNKIAVVSTQPFMGKQSLRKPEVRSILITKHNRLYYKFHNDTIIILNLYDTRSNPKKNPYNL